MGSEMCIRDRAGRHGQAGIPARRGDLPRFAGYAGQRPAGGPPCGCLLYTSDAADEEDSVDLGGRRILKKKDKRKKKKNQYIKD